MMKNEGVDPLLADYKKKSMEKECQMYFGRVRLFQT
jgi:hypothetical protein